MYLPQIYGKCIVNIPDMEHLGNISIHHLILRSSTWAGQITIELLFHWRFYDAVKNNPDSMRVLESPS